MEIGFEHDDNVFPTPESSASQQLTPPGQRAPPSPTEHQNRFSRYHANPKFLNEAESSRQAAARTQVRYDTRAARHETNDPQARQVDSPVVNVERQLMVYDPLGVVLGRVERFLREHVVVNEGMGLMINFLCSKLRTVFTNQQWNLKVDLDELFEREERTLRRKYVAKLCYLILVLVQGKFLNMEFQLEGNMIISRGMLMM